MAVVPWLVSAGKIFQTGIKASCPSSCLAVYRLFFFFNWTITDKFLRYQETDSISHLIEGKQSSKAISLDDKLHVLLHQNLNKHLFLFLKQDSICINLSISKDSIVIILSPWTKVTQSQSNKMGRALHNGHQTTASTTFWYNGKNSRKHWTVIYMQH